MDAADDGAPFGSPMSASRGTPRRRANGDAPAPRLKQLPVSVGLTVPSRPRRPLADEDIDRMLDRVVAAADEESDSDGEIEIPVPVGRARREGANPLAGS